MVPASMGANKINADITLAGYKIRKFGNRMVPESMGANKINADITLAGYMLVRRQDKPPSPTMIS